MKAASEESGDASNGETCLFKLNTTPTLSLTFVRSLVYHLPNLHSLDVEVRGVVDGAHYGTSSREGPEEVAVSMLLPFDVVLEHGLEQLIFCVARNVDESLYHLVARCAGALLTSFHRLHLVQEFIFSFSSRGLPSQFYFLNLQFKRLFPFKSI